MPSIPNPLRSKLCLNSTQISGFEISKHPVFITGSTEYIGSQVVAATLKAGYRVRLSIRMIEQESALRKRYPGFNTDIETVVISDLSNVDDFQKPLRGVDYIFHIASPMAGKGVGFRDGYVNAAVEGTLAVLNAAMIFKGSLFHQCYHW
ncbi:hypothetical protein N7481_004986 [Penicillium waksmanii]|uniref:uncharacterized protein n=1 Tax=Penicillium waksmanii TaxID=69791 RepID=UPI00254862BD|nr:uncharacterized protein N7481_004986 [Penicillium waksmanii]KAJ5982887.1 hypothetical protein N7481_004986 [Penicillium waksmanii]